MDTKMTSALKVCEPEHRGNTQSDIIQSVNEYTDHR